MITIAKTIFAELLHDRLIQVGTGSSGLSIFGATTIDAAPPAWVGHVTAYIGLYAAVIGALTATVTFIYAILKIRRILRQPTAPVE